MMQEDELVSKDDIRNEGHVEIRPNNTVTREISPISLTGKPLNLLSTKYNYTKFELFVSAVVMFSTISGGYLEGYTSPAIPSLMEDSLNQNILIDNKSSLNTLNPFISSTTLEYDIVSLVSVTDIIEHATESVLQSSESDKGLLNMSNIYIKENSTDSLLSNLNFNVTNDLLNNNTDHYKDYQNATTLEPLPQPLPLTYLNSEKKVSTNSSNLSIEVSKEEASWLGSLLLLGACFGAGFSPCVVSFGRRHTIIFSALPRIVGWILIAAASSVSVIYAGRFLCGISLGIASAAVPIYISEVAHPSLRGSLSCIVQMGVNIGIFLVALFGTFMAWRILAVFGALTVLLYFIPSYFLPNSPSWLIFKGRENEAREVLKKLRTHDYCVEEELQQIITVVEKSTKGSTISWSDLLQQRRTVMPLVVVVLVTLVNRFSGYNAIITYCSTFIHQAVPSVSQYFAAVAVCFVQILATVGSIFLVDNWGRRKLLLLSVCVMGGSLIFVAICDQFIGDSGGGTWLAVLGTMTYVSAYSLGIGPLTWVLLGELFPLDARDKASAIVAVLNWFTAFLVTKTYFSLESSTGIAGTCTIYASVCLMGIFFIYFLVPETKGRTLTEIEVHFTYTQRRWRPPLPKVDRALSSILDQDVATIDTYSTFH